MHRFKFFGVLFILLSFALGAYTTYYIVGQGGVLGTNDEVILQEEFSSDKESQSEKAIEDVAESIPEKSPQPTAMPEPQKTEAEVILEESTKDEINVSSPLTEIIIKNEDNALIITTSSDDTELVKIPTDEKVDDHNTESPQAATEVYEVQPVQEHTESTSFSESDNLDSKTSTLIGQIQSRLSLPRNKEKSDASSATPPASAIKITYTSNNQQIKIDDWLKDYQFQVWALGEDYIAIHRDGITTITPYAIKLGLSKLSFKVETDSGEMQVLYYPDSIWSYLSDLHIITDSTHDEPILLVAENDQLVYRIKASSKQLMFAVLPSSICMKVVISAQTREIKDTRTCSPWDTVKDLVSITVG